MKITFLGTGTNTPTPQRKGLPFRSYSAISCEIGKETILFDIGPGTVTKLQQLGISTATTPTTLFISHFHIDHCLDYLALIKERALRMVRGERLLKLIVYGPKGLLKWHEQLWTIESWSYMVKELHALESIELIEVEEGKDVLQKNWKARAFSVPHDDGLAYKIESEGKTFVYSGDMGFVSSFADFSQNADMVAIECSFPDRRSVDGTHLYPEQIGELAKHGLWKQTVLTHLYPACEGKEQKMVQTIQSMAPRTKIVVAYDFLKMDL